VNQDSIKNENFFRIFLKGLAMGSADVVPGVSGGTIAFITGVYKRLLDSINEINIKSFKLLTHGNLSGFWKRVDGKFLLTIFCGIAVSIISLSRLVSWGLKNYSDIVWSFFFGLILASIPLIFSRISKNANRTSWIPHSIIGILIGSFITLIPPANYELSLSYVFLSGFLAICAMILPGISGSFILILLGSYQGILEGLNSVNWRIILVFIFGALLGLLSFARLLKYWFEKAPNAMTGLMGGFIIGSLMKIYPFKSINSFGVEYPRVFSLEDPIFSCIVASLLGFAIVSLLNRFKNIS
jgi:putative membrane protein